MFHGVCDFNTSWILPLIKRILSNFMLYCEQISRSNYCFWVSVVISNLHTDVIRLQSSRDPFPTVCLALASRSVWWTLVQERARRGYKPLSTWREERLASPDQTNPLSAPPDSLLLTCSLAPTGLRAPHLNLCLIYAQLCCEPTCLFMLFMW